MGNDFQISDAFADALQLIADVERGRKAPESAGRHVLDGAPYEIAKALVNLCEDHDVPPLAPWLVGITVEDAKKLRDSTTMKLAWFKENGPYSSHYYKAMLDAACAGEQWRQSQTRTFRVRWVEAKTDGPEEAGKQA